MKGIVLFIIVLLLLIISIVIGSQNTQIISVNYLIAKADMRLSTFMVISLGTGIFIGFAIMAVKYLGARMQARLLQRRIKKLSKES